MANPPLGFKFKPGLLPPNALLLPLTNALLPVPLLPLVMPAAGSSMLLPSEGLPAAPAAAAAATAAATADACAASLLIGLISPPYAAEPTFPICPVALLLSLTCDTLSAL